MSIFKRKTVICLVCIILLVCFTACAKNEESAETPGGMMGVANPMQAFSVKEFETETGFAVDMPADDFADLAVFKYNFEQPLYQFGFIYTDGNEYTFRIQKTEDMADISGMYFEWEQQGEYADCTVSTMVAGQGICLWYDGEYTYCISMDANAEETVLVSMQQLLVSAFMVQ